MTYIQPVTTSVWAVSDTVNRGVNFATGMVAAVTSDNIDPAALLTCTAFGSLLPVSVETRVKVEQLAQRNSSSQLLTFFKTQIGYRKNDSIEHMSRCDSGVRFLCLVATLSALNYYDAAAHIDTLLQVTDRDDQVRPTIQQLQIMMCSLCTKLTLSDFGNSVVGFKVMLQCKLGSNCTFTTTNIPSKKYFRKLVLAICEIERCDEARRKALEITLHHSYAAWTCAFVKWLLGSSPQVRTSRGDIVIDGDGSPIILTITDVTRLYNAWPRGSDSKIFRTRDFSWPSRPIPHIRNGRQPHKDTVNVGTSLLDCELNPKISSTKLQQHLPAITTCQMIHHMLALCLSIHHCSSIITWAVMVLRAQSRVPKNVSYGSESQAVSNLVSTLHIA